MNSISKISYLLIELMICQNILRSQLMNISGTSYVLATGAAMGTALGLNAMVKNMPPLAGRIVPFVAVAAANCINIPMMRKSELENGKHDFVFQNQYSIIN